MPRPTDLAQLTRRTVLGAIGITSLAVNGAAGGENNSPEASDDSYSTPEDTQLSVSAPGVLTNDTDPDGDSLTASLISTPSNGSVDLNSDGSFTYTPDINFNGADAFEYEAADGNGNTDTATVSITVRPVNDPPIANDDFYSTDQAMKLSVSAPGVLANDADPDEGDRLTASLVTGPSNGSIVLRPNGAFTYTPDPSFTGTDTFEYEVADRSGATDTATVSITVTPVADPATKGQCMNGGWEEFGFTNQGRCIRYVETGKDSRD